MIHLVYCDNVGKKGARTLDKIISGHKTMIVRGAAGRKIPHSRVQVGETLYFMEKGSLKISAKAVVTQVENFVKLTEEEINEAFLQRRDQLALSEKQRTRWHKKCLCFVTFSEVAIITPLAFHHQGNMDDWLILDKIDDVVVGTSIPYNYDKSRFKK